MFEDDSCCLNMNDAQYPQDTVLRSLQSKGLERSSVGMFQSVQVKIEPQEYPQNVPSLTLTTAHIRY